MSRFSLTGSVAVLGAAAVARRASAAEAHFNDVGAFTKALNDFHDGVNANVTAITAIGGAYHSLATMLLTAMAVFYLVIAVTKYVFGEKDHAALLGSIIYIVIIVAIFSLYSTVVDILGRAPYAVVSIIQKTALGSDDLFAPMTYLFKVISNIGFDLEETSFWNIVGLVQDALVAVSLALVFLVLQVFYFAAVIWSLLFPMVYIFVLKITGYIVIPFLLSERLAFLFDGWLRQFFGLIIFIVLANAVVIANVMLVEYTFNVPYASTVSQVVVGAFFAYLVLLATLAIGAVAIFSSHSIATSWANAANLSTGGGAVVRTAVARFITR